MAEEASFRRYKKINEIDYLIETHSDDDHSGGIEEIVHNLNIAQIYMPKSAINKSKIKDEVSINIFSDLEQIYNLSTATWKVLSVDNNEIELTLLDINLNGNKSNKV